MGALILFEGLASRIAAQAPTAGEDRARSAPDKTAGLPNEFLILSNVSDFNDFLKKLKQPDWIFMKPGAPGAAPPPGAAAGERALPRSHVVTSVKIRGRVDNDLADLSLELELNLLVQGQAWVPLGIDSQIVTSAREGDRELELRSTGEGRWDVRLDRPGAHRLLLDLRRPVTASPDRKHLELAIPEALSTYLELEVSHRVREVDVGSGASVGESLLPGAEGTRLSAHLSPRSRLVLDWTEEANSGSPAPPLLTAQVEMRVDADWESMRTESSWVIRSVRGIARKLEIQLDEADVVARVKLDDQFFPAGIERNMLTIPLGEPLRPGDTRHLFLETRRSFPPAAPRSYLFTGFPLSNAAEQSGAIAITQAANLWVNVTTAQGLRPIDPQRLPAELRALPGTSHAFLFLDQPFRLGLGVESSPPLFRSETAARLVLDGDMARTDASIEIQRVRGRLFEIDVTVPSALQVVSIGPPDLVESATPAPLPDPAGSGSPGTATEQILRIHLTPAARDQRSFTLRLRGQERMGHDSEVKLSLFSPRGGVSASSTLSMFADPNISFEAIDEPGRPEPPVFRLQPQEERAAAFTASRPGERALLAVWKSNGNPTHLRGRLIRHPLMIRHTTTISAQVSEHWVDVRQETALQVRYGLVSSLIVRVPVARSELWQIQGKESIRREELGPSPRDEKSRRFRLFFDPPIKDRSSLTFSFRVPLEPTLEAGREFRGTIPWILFEEGVSASSEVELTAAPSVKASGIAGAWVGRAEEKGEPGDSGVPEHYHLAKPGSESAGFPFRARMLNQLALPALVAPRALLRTVLGPESESRTHAWYWIESHPSRVSFGLPEGAQWIRLRIDGRGLEPLERDPEGGGYRITFPAESQSRAVLIEIEYQLKEARADRPWTPPELLEGAVVLQSLWQVHVPWSQALVGVPEGWSDENEWYWDFYYWKRRPWRSFSRLLAWVSGSAAQPFNLDEVLGEEQDDSHAYLFGRSGQPVALRPWVVSRALLVAICSGSVLLLALCLMLFKVRFTVVWALVAALGLLLAVVAHPSVLLLVLQSAASGVVLGLLGLLIHALIERARFAPTVGPISAPPEPLAGTASPVGVGSDDSTAIRARVPSTLDYVSPLSPPAEPEPARGSRIVQSG
jgi:hypothetical protein